MTQTTRSTAGLVLRSLALGIAAGSRASMGVAAPLLTSRTTGGGWAAAKVAAVAGIAGELVGDKLPRTPSRLLPPGPLTRILSGGIGGLLLARRAGSWPVLALVAGAAGGAIGTWGGAAWRANAVEKRPDWQPAFIEDGVALSLAAFACLSDRP